jgi:hypothetical protein
VQAKKLEDPYHKVAVTGCQHFGSSNKGVDWGNPLVRFKAKLFLKGVLDLLDLDILS